jgi:hypothetical protein
MDRFMCKKLALELYKKSGLIPLSPLIQENEAIEKPRKKKKSLNLMF